MSTPSSIKPAMTTVSKFKDILTVKSHSEGLLCHSPFADFQTLQRSRRIPGLNTEEEEEEEEEEEGLVPAMQSRDFLIPVFGGNFVKVEKLIY